MSSFLVHAADIAKSKYHKKNLKALEKKKISSSTAHKHQLLIYIKKSVATSTHSYVGHLRVMSPASMHEHDVRLRASAEP
jgi:hypothetical protein